MTRHDAETEIAAIRARIDRLQVRALFLQTRLRHIAPEPGEPRPGWPIARGLQTIGARISASSPPRIAV